MRTHTDAALTRTSAAYFQFFKCILSIRLYTFLTFLLIVIMNRMQPIIRLISYVFHLFFIYSNRAIVYNTVTVMSSNCSHRVSFKSTPPSSCTTAISDHLNRTWRQHEKISYRSKCSDWSWWRLCTGHGSHIHRWPHRRCRLTACIGRADRTASSGSSLLVWSCLPSVYILLRKKQSVWDMGNWHWFHVIEASNINTIRFHTIWFECVFSNTELSPQSFPQHWWFATDTWRLCYSTLRV